MEPKILIADDEAYVRLLMEQALEDLEDGGVELLLASNGEEALEIIQAERPQLVFLDVMMPKMSGFEVCRLVKRELRLDDVYVVMLIAKGHDYDRQKGYEAGADTYVTKPFDPDELLEMAEQVLDL